MRFCLLLLLFLGGLIHGYAQCDTSRWKAYWVNDDYSDTLSPLLKASDFIKDGILKVPFSLSSQQYCVGTNCPKTRISFKDTTCITSNFSFEVRLRNTPTEQGFDAFDVGIEIQGNSGTNYGCVLMGNSWAQRFTSVYAGSTNIVNKPQLVMNLEDWTIIKFQCINNVLHYYKDNLEFFQLPYAHTICNILGFSFIFKGSGSIDWIQMKDASGQTLYHEDFNSCHQLSLFPDNCNPDSLKMDIHYLPPTCKEPNLQLFASSNAPLIYSWTGPNGFTSKEQTPIIFNATTAAIGTYTVEGSVNTCTPPITKTIGVDFKLPKTITVDTAICYGKSYNGYTSTGIYVDTFSSVNGCDSIRTLKLTVLPQLHPDLGADTYICPGDTLTLSPGDFTSYLWQDGSTSSNYVVKQPGIYSITVANSCGTAKATVVIALGGCHFYFPTAFSPNKDGKNEVFKILSPEHAYAIRNYYLIIYNRWGQKIFETRDYTKGWDGSVNGSPQETGTYIWYCEWTRQGSSQRMIRNGTVTLIK